MKRRVDEREEWGGGVVLDLGFDELMLDGVGGGFACFRDWRESVACKMGRQARTSQRGVYKSYKS